MRTPGHCSYPGTPTLRAALQELTHQSHGLEAVEDAKHKTPPSIKETLDTTSHEDVKPDTRYYTVQLESITYEVAITKVRTPTQGIR